MIAFSRRVKVLIVALIIAVCVLLYFWLHVTSLKSEADGVWLLADDGVQERDRMKLNVSGLIITLKLLSRSQTLSSIVQHRRGKGLGAFPGDDVSFPLGLGGVINVNL